MRSLQCRFKAPERSIMCNLQRRNIKYLDQNVQRIAVKTRCAVSLGARFLPKFKWSHSTSIQIYAADGDSATSTHEDSSTAVSLHLPMMLLVELSAVRRRTLVGIFVVPRSVAFVVEWLLCLCARRRVRSTRADGYTRYSRAGQPYRRLSCADAI